ncbi:MAG: (4Fe-4S)-binding protein [Bacteroidota bacterium]|nr:(4Fe-4S)-binding protein [Bacteroidota bacterium]
MIKKEYTKGDLIIFWQPELCIHSAVCFHSLPAVFKPRERPWIQLEGADNAQIEATVKACPSGAISLKSMTTTDPISIHPTGTDAMKVTIIPNGPSKVSGPCQVVLEDGTILEKPNGVTICRCGQSSNKPFCDGSHKTNGFIG